MNRLGYKVLAALTAGAVVIGAAGAANADNLEADTDTLTAGLQSTVELSATPGQSQDVDVDLSIKCTSKNAHMAGDTTVSMAPVGAGGSSIPAGGSLVASSVTIAKPATWPADGTNCDSLQPSTAAQTSTVTVGAPNAVGVYSYTLKWTSSDADVNASAGTVTITVTVGAAGNPCDAVAVPAAPTFSFAPDGDDGWYVTGPTVSASSSGATVSYATTSGGPYGSAPTLSDGQTTVYAVATSSTCSKVSLESSQLYKVDTLDPDVTLSGGPTSGGTYYEGEPIEAAPTCDATDATSGVNGVCTVTGYGTTAGTYNVTASATDFAGNEGTSSTLTYTVLADPTPPGITGTLDPAAPDGGDGWYKTDVSLTWTVSESETPTQLTKTGCVDQSITADQAEISYSCSATSGGGSAGPVTKSIKRDATAPTVSLTLGSGIVAGGGSYYEGEVPGAPTCGATDALSGVNGSCAVSGYSTAVGPHTVKATASDVAGNEGESTSIAYTVLDDTSPPVITKVITPATPDGSNGWYTSDVSIDWTVSEPQTPSSLVVTGCVDVTISADQMAAAYTCDASSLGGQATGQSVTIKRDAASPGVDIQSPTDGSSTTASSVHVTGAYSDATSGVATVSVKSSAETSGATGGLSGGTFTRTGVPLDCGGNTITATATDDAGNSSSDSVSVYRQCFTGAFQQPLDGAGVLNKAKLGRVVPVKLTIAANSGQVPTPVYFGTRAVPCTGGVGTDEVEVYLAAGSSNLGNMFRLADGAWVYNLDTSKLPGAAVNKCYQLDVYVGGSAGADGIASGGVAVQNGSVRITLTK